MPTTATSPSTAITGLGQVALTVRDVARSTAFYRDQVGLPFLFGAGPGLSFLDIGGVRLMLSSPEGEFVRGVSSVLYLKVDDIMSAFAAMTARGVVFVDEPHLIAPMPDHDLWMCFFRDPDRHTLALMCEREKGAR
jgi:methylmalonyl-CoA/ethylmalonyl-CoA epimerase